MEQGISVQFNNVEEMRMGSFRVGEAWLQINDEAPVKIGDNISPEHYLIIGNQQAVFLKYAMQGEDGIYASGYHAVLVEFKPLQIKQSAVFIESILRLIGLRENSLEMIVYDDFPNTKNWQVDL